ncbi:NUDIX hydrolase [Psychromonas sp. PRT-SC03]|nr:NUDIX hydrolase [Psychromonas sp. PRT-SC03]
MSDVKSVIVDQDKAWWFIIAQKKILLLQQGGVIPYVSASELSLPASILAHKIKIGEYQSHPCYLITDEEESASDLGSYENARILLGKIDENLFNMLGRALQVSLFYQTHQYCGQCGEKMHRVDWEVACQCIACKHRCYPRISPCIIVAIRKDKEILLALHQRHYQNKEEIYTVLAGFVEAGEALEHCLQREVFEEVGIKVKNIRYVRSQPWPFPHSLMMAYIAEYDSGDICIDTQEIRSAAWYGAKNLPALPNKGTVARELISHVLAECDSF